MLIFPCERALQGRSLQAQLLFHARKAPMLAKRVSSALKLGMRQQSAARY